MLYRFAGFSSLKPAVASLSLTGIIFVTIILHSLIEAVRSGSMGINDNRPLQNTPVTARIAARHNNRVGAVYSSLYGFWQARASALNAAVGNGVPRRDAYSVVLFDHHVYRSVINDFTSSPDDLLNGLMAYGSGGGTNYTLATTETQSVMESNWSTERYSFYNNLTCLIV